MATNETPVFKLIECPFCRQRVSETQCTESSHKDCLCYIESLRDRPEQLSQR